MPKGNRGKRDYEREIDEAAKRMQKYPEHLKAASDSEEWHNFLQDIGIFTSYSDRGNDFWSQVRDKVTIKETGFTARGLAEQGIERFFYTKKVQARDAKGHFTSQIIGQKQVVAYRDYETKRFIKEKSFKKY